MLPYFSAFSIIFPLAVSLYCYKFLSAELKIVCWLFIFAALIEIFNVIVLTTHTNNLRIVNVYVLAEGAVYFYVIARWFESAKMFRLTIALFGVYFIVWIYTTFISGSFSDLNNKEKTLKGILLIILSGYLLIRISTEDSTMMTRDYRFWILSAILIYFSITEVVLATANFILENEPVIRYAWTFHSVINIIANFLFAIGFACTYRKSKFSG
jgi:hypothetical protein